MDFLFSPHHITIEDTLFVDRDGKVVFAPDPLSEFFTTYCLMPDAGTIAVPLSGNSIIGLRFRDIWDRILTDTPERESILTKLDLLLKLEIQELLIEIHGGSRVENKDIFLNILKIRNISEFIPIQHIDITEWISHDKNLKKTLQRLKHVIDNQSDFICLLHKDGTLSYANEPFCKRFLQPCEEIMGQHFSNALPYGSVRDEFNRMLVELNAENPCFAIQHIVEDPGKLEHVKWIRWEIKAIIGEDREIKNLHITGREIADQDNDSTDHQKEKTLLKMAFNDPITGLPNRFLFIDRLNQLIIRAKRYKSRLALMHIDLDNFKKINESLGHEAGDLLLKEVSLRVKECLRDSDIIARIGGDEFAIILPEIERTEGPAIVAQRIIKSINSPFLLSSHEVYVTASIGIGSFPDDGGAAEDLLKNSETAMYFAKSQDKNNYQFFNTGMNQYALERLNVENDMRRAIEKEEFVLHFQPQISIASGKIIGVEALVRWVHPERGHISPVKFIPVAEETGLIIPLSELVLNQALREAVRWTESGLPPITVAVNISLKHFKQPNFAEFILDTVKQYSLDPRMLELELTESILMHDVQSVINTLDKLRNHGIQISIDDFGTGYSSLNYLKNLPISRLKIDKSFVNNITIDNKDSMIVKTIIEIAHNLDLKVIAEGVEHIEQMKFLGGLNCDEMQGFFFSKPLPVRDFVKLFETMLIL